MGKFAEGKAFLQTDDKYQSGSTIVKKGWGQMIPAKVCVEYLAV